MKLFVSVLLLAAASAGVAQQTPSTPGTARMEVGPGGGLSPQVLLWQGRQMRDLTLPEIWAPLQAGCPVVMTSAHLNWPASYLPVTSAEKTTSPNLALRFSNRSGKPIRSVSITARFLTKQDIYRLDATAFDLRLTLSDVDSAGEAAEQLREIRLPEKMHAYGVTRIALEQVTFTDGTFWVSSGTNCSLNFGGSTRRVEAR